MKCLAQAVRLVALLFVVALPLSGCSSSTNLRMYEGSQLPADSIANVSSISPKSQFDYVGKKSAYWHYTSSLNTWILEFDGQKLKMDDVNKHANLEVLPGEHRLKVAADLGGKAFDDPELLVFRTEAGESYLLMARKDEGPETNQIIIRFWVMDSSGKVVAGTK